MKPTPLDAGESSRMFQLYLLSVMRVNPDVLARALQQLHSTEAELQKVRLLMKGRGYEKIGGPDVQFYEEMLGNPVSQISRKDLAAPEPFRFYTVSSFKLSNWPDFDFVVNVLADGRTFNPSFRRSLNVTVPVLTSFSHLEPWKFVKEEVDSSFGLPQVGDAWDNWEELHYMVPKSAGEVPQQCCLVFDFNLLQSADDKN